MSVTHNATLRNTIAAAVLAAIDAQSNAGKLIIKDASNVVLATFQLGATPNTKPSGTVSGAVLTLANVTVVNASATGTAAKFDFTDDSSTVILSGTVTATGGGGDITLDSVSLVSGSPVTVTNGGTYTAAL
jgi:hypothetical protein